MKYKKGDIICPDNELLMMHRVAVVKGVGPISISLEWYKLTGEGGKGILYQYSKVIRDRKVLELSTTKVGGQLGHDTSFIYGIPYQMHHLAKPTHNLHNYDDTAVI